MAPLLYFLFNSPRSVASFSLIDFFYASLGGFPCGSDSKRVCLQCRRWGFDPWVGKFLWRRKWLPWWLRQTVKCLPAMWETWVQSLGQEDPLEKEMATHSCLENSMDGGAWWARLGHIERLHVFT